MLLAICVIVPVALLIVATRGGPSHDRTCEQTAQRATISTTPGLTAKRVISTGDPAPTFALRTLDCARLDTASYRGKPYVVTFWASWCVPCRKEMPLLQRAYSRRHGDLPVVGVTYQEPASDSRSFAGTYDVTFPLAPDDGFKVAKTFGVVSVPVTFFVGGDGRVVERVAGNGSTKDLDAALHRLLA
ncbi:MAG: cytochrome c biosis protein CcmG, thiol:disulfide interchange protein DsbE [Actinomycetota bacterium]|nr:cytochrome c biosis protein CcmG, thiol:disulfide interchange protein DsbE [Actinomycetota bacterium]